MGATVRRTPRLSEVSVNFEWRSSVPSAPVGSVRAVKKSETTGGNRHEEGIGPQVDTPAEERGRLAPCGDSGGAG